MVWKQLSLTPSHLTYILLSAFLIVYALFSQFIRNRLHLAEPPLATLFGILVGPNCLGIIDPKAWIDKDSTTEEITRIVVGVQVFAIGVELPRRWIKARWGSLAMLLGPVMGTSYLVTAGLVYFIADTELLTAFIVSACLAPTDPVLAASVLGNSHFSERIPKRLRDVSDFTLLGLLGVLPRWEERICTDFCSYSEQSLGRMTASRSRSCTFQSTSC